MMKMIVTMTLLSVLSLSGVSAQERRVEMRPPEGAAVAINPMRVDIDEYVNRITLPPGFEISVYARGIEARSMSRGPDGIVFVGTRFTPDRQVIGKVYAVLDNNGDYRADQIITIAEGLNVPNGVAYRDGDLYVAEINRVLRYDNIVENLHSPPEPVVIRDDFPEDIHHGWKFIRFGPDGSLYVPVGAPCNVCETADSHGVITRMDPDGANREIFARGIRNTVGFDWHPDTGELWFTDNGRDLWGDDRPPEEINHAPVPGMHFGFPYRYGKGLVDDEFPAGLADDHFTPSAYEMPAHTAGLGVRFYTGSSFPKQYSKQLLVAYHGSWNRSSPAGYNVAVINMENSKVTGHEYLATGWLIDGRFWGRPVDIEILPDGSVLVSDDFANCIYRISYHG